MECWSNDCRLLRAAFDRWKIIRPYTLNLVNPELATDSWQSIVEYYGLTPEKRWMITLRRGRKKKSDATKHVPPLPAGD
jgi:hypothetical protein